MIHVGNLRKESVDGWTRLIADITDGGIGQNYLPDSVMWLAVRDEDAHMLADDVYDAFVLIPLYYGMYYKQDVHIHGFVSKKLYKNVINYLQQILCDFSPNLSRIDIQVDGFKEAEVDPDVRAIGTGISCGVDSLATIYNWYIKENDPDFRINGLFFLNAGWHGCFGHEGTLRLFFDRYALNKPPQMSLICRCISLTQTFTHSTTNFTPAKLGQLDISRITHAFWDYSGQSRSITFRVHILTRK